MIKLKINPLTFNFDFDKLLLWSIIIFIGVPLIAFIILPIIIVLAKSFQLSSGIWGLGNYTTTFSEGHFWQVVTNSVMLASLVTVITVSLALIFVYGMQRSKMPGKKYFSLIALLPIFAPSLLQALGIIFLLGRNGIINRWFGLEIEIYGFWGIVIADTIYAFPQAYLLLTTTLAVADSRPYEAARMLGAGKVRTFFDVTMPNIKFGLTSTIFLVFTITITDFGNAMVIGGNFSVLATEIYNQVAGQMNFNLGSVVAIVLLVPVAIAFLIEKVVLNKKKMAHVPDNCIPLVIRKNKTFDSIMFTSSALICGVIFLVFAIVVFASFVKLWPYNMSFTFDNYIFDSQGGYKPLYTSIYVSLLAAILGVVMVVSAGYIVNKTTGILSSVINFFSILPAAIPGMVLGISYILFFNEPLNPLNIIYGTILLLALNSMYHFHAQGFLSALTALKQIPRSFDQVSSSLGASMFTTINKITLPILAPVIITIAVFFFMRAMVTLSSVIFLVSPKVNLAAVSVMLLDDAGNSTQAAAYSTLIVLVVLISLVILKLLLKLLKTKVVLQIS